MDIDALGREPIPGASQVGQDARYDLEYDQLQGEIDKLNSVTSLAEVNWKRVVELGTNILETKSKDLLAAVYLSVGLLHEAGLEGMGTGSQVLRDMVATYWDDCFPPKKRLRGRMNAFSWWQEKTTAWLKGLPSDPVPAELHRTILENVEALLLSHTAGVDEQHITGVRAKAGANLRIRRTWLDVVQPRPIGEE